MEPGLVIGLSIATILILAIIMDRLRLPLVLGMLIAGSLIGPFSPLKGLALGPIDTSAIIVADPSVVDIFALIGAALILFGIGLEFSIMNLLRLGFSTVFAAAVKNAVVLLVGYGAAITLGFTQPAALLLAAMLSFSSTPVIIKLLESSGKLKRLEVPLIVSILIVEDFFAVFLLGVLSLISPTSGQHELIIPLFKTVLTFIFAYIILSKLVRYAMNAVSHSDELLALTTISLVLLIGYFSQWIGLSFSVGAFLAGSVLAGSLEARRIEGIIRPFNTVFASMFFFSIGMLVDFKIIAASLALTLIIAAIATFAKFVGSALSAYLVGFNGRSACFTAASLLTLSEMSLLIAKEATASKLLGPEVLSISAAVIILTALLSILLMPREAELYRLFTAIIPRPVLTDGRALRVMSLNIRHIISERFRYRKIIDSLPLLASEPPALRPREQFEQAGGNSLLFLFISLLSLFVIIYSEPAQSLAVLFLIIYLASSLLLTLNVKSLFDSLYLILFPNERGSLLTIGKNLALFSVLFFLSLAWLSLYLFFPKTQSLLISLPALLLSLSYLPSIARAIFLSFTTFRSRL